nr:uncharacterized protein LOC117681901 [Crassostrea gigas]
MAVHLRFPADRQPLHFWNDSYQILPGKWQILVADLTWQGNKCPSPAGCGNVTTKKDAFDLLYNNFATNYEGNREPYIIVLDSVWVKTDYKLGGTIQF